AVGEPAAASFAVSPEAKAQVLADQAQARLGEGAKLAALGKLTPSAANELANRFQVLSDEAQKRQAQVAEKSPAAAARLACGLQASLDGQTDLLATLKAQANGAGADALANLQAAAQA